jgi:hypothetical protein
VIVSLNFADRLICVIEARCVFFELGTVFINII